jgi:thioredoxin 1
MIPLLVVVAVFAGLHLASKRFKGMKGKTRMGNVKNVAIVAIVIVAVAGAVFLKQTKKAAPESPSAGNTVTPVPASSAVGEPLQTVQGKALPRLVDLGAKSCIPCKMMAPILEDLKREYAGTFKTEFVDVWQDPEPGRKYGIRVIPTQIFFDAEGKELFRHEGFFSKEDILSKWKEMGADLAGQEPK